MELPRQMRRDAELSLDQHELRAMMHLVLLGAQQLLEARLGTCPVGYGDHFRQELGRQRL